MLLKKIRGAFLSVVLLISMVLPIHTAVATTPMTTVDTVEVNGGETITLVHPDAMSQSDIPVSINGISGCGVRTFTFDLRWDTAVIHVIDFTPAVIDGFLIPDAIPDNSSPTGTL